MKGQEANNPYYGVTSGLSTTLSMPAGRHYPPGQPRQQKPDKVLRCSADKPSLTQARERSMDTPVVLPQIFSDRVRPFVQD